MIIIILIFISIGFILKQVVDKKKNKSYDNSQWITYNNLLKISIQGLLDKTIGKKMKKKILRENKVEGVVPQSACVILFLFGFDPIKSKPYAWYPIFSGI